MGKKPATKVILPREKALQFGVNNLSDVELVALFIRTGNRTQSVLQLAQELIDRIGGLGNILAIKNHVLQEIKGIGVAKSLEILASIELVRRIRAAAAEEKTVSIHEPNSIYELLIDHFRDLRREIFWVVLLDAKNMVIHKKKLYDGTSSQLLIDTKDVFRFALENDAAKLVCAHNHPSGNPEPSEADRKTTKQIGLIAKKLNLLLLDHIVFGKKAFYSIALNQQFPMKSTARD